jgi:large subunit ribosomal protein L15
MDLSTLNRGANKRKARKRVGRGHGSGNGKTAGKGHKGARARSGFKTRAGFEGGQTPLHRRLPKRGFHHAARYPVSEINLDALENGFNAGDEVTAEILLARGMAKSRRGGVKILGRGELTKKLTVRVAAVSEAARNKIEAAGGTIEIVEPKPKTAEGAEEA